MQRDQPPRAYKLPLQAAANYEFPRRVQHGQAGASTRKRAPSMRAKQALSKLAELAPRRQEQEQRIQELEEH